MWKLKLGLAIFIIGFFTLVGMKMNKNNKEVVAVETECVPTELFVIGNHARVTRVYDCSNLEEKEDGTNND